MLSSPSGANPSIMAAFISRGAESLGDTVENATFENLTGIQVSPAQVLACFDKLETPMGNFEMRMDGLETGMREDRRNAAGMLVMMFATAGDFDARVSEVEERVAALEGRTG